MIRNPPALKYHGSKYLLAPWIISHFPPHETYVEPFGGSAAILLNKPPAKYEVYNDIDGDVVNFFTMLRDHTKELVRAIRLTPYARSEFLKCLEEPSSLLSPVERARRFYVLCWMGMAYNRRQSNGWRLLPYNKTGGHVPQALFARVSHLYRIARRLKAVQIEQGEWWKVANRCQSATTLTYFDPPYHGVARNSHSLYTFEMTGSFEHAMFLSEVRKVEGSVVISAYQSELYDEMLAGWRKVHRRTVNRRRNERMETLYIRDGG